MNNQKQGGNTGGVIAAFIAGAATATVAAGYFLYGPKGKANRKKVEAWVNDAQEEVIERFEAAKDMTAETYESVVDEVMARYAALKEVGEERAETLADDLKERFEEASEEVKRLKKEMAEKAEKAAKIAKKK